MPPIQLPDYPITRLPDYPVIRLTDSVERLWSPWRLAYVTGTETATGCIFCEATGPHPDPAREALVLVRGRVSYVILNLYPYNNGHLMVAPNRHIGSLAAATPEELSEMMQFTRDAE